MVGFQKPVEPYVVLIAGTKADMLADALGDVFSNVTEKGEIDRIFCNEYKERQLLESEVTNSLSKYSKSVVLHGKLLEDFQNFKMNILVILSIEQMGSEK